MLSKSKQSLKSRNTRDFSSRLEFTHLGKRWFGFDWDRSPTSSVHLCFRASEQLPSCQAWNSGSRFANSWQGLANSDTRADHFQAPDSCIVRLPFLLCFSSIRPISLFHTIQSLSELHRWQAESPAGSTYCRIIWELVVRGVGRREDSRKERKERTGWGCRKGRLGSRLRC